MGLVSEIWECYRCGHRIEGDDDRAVGLANDHIDEHNFYDALEADLFAHYEGAGE